ncbi:L,D-transpeptidase family protein [Sphingomonas radiodurans]|uniref:L,D-transpeptidase family protein n=1 Tax=Sphingomonas radiodurans TaxID=2890321 RepID=UPI001E31E2E1|nr:L,D-transpeptidase family protein [Sphingomonas radiodurans]WBH17497.1 L,D-transpeptidase family protein [Sphingomonas radiodurans]
MRMIRALLPAVFGIVAFTSTPALAESVTSSVALVEAAASLAPGKYLWEEDAAAGPVSILISIPDQKAYVYRGERLVAVSTVSTGKEGNDTPVGIFTILQKKEMHRSNLYDDAPMPFMQRLTWDGVAIHAGRNPGFPASHGCIRVPASFAKKLFAATEMGATVEITDIAYSGDTPAPRSDAQLTAAANAATTKDLSRFLASRKLSF